MCSIGKKKRSCGMLEQKLLRQLTNMEHDEEKRDRRFIYREKCVDNSSNSINGRPFYASV